MKAKLQQLRQQLNDCRISDLHNLKRRLQQAEQRVNNHQPVDRMVAQIEETVAASVKAVTDKRTLVGEVRYPDLPVSSRREEIQEAIRDHQVVVVAGETGSGKTTQLPKICLELGLGARGLIGHTQPRRLAARAVANRIAEELQTEVGKTVGYQVRFTDQVSEQSMVKLMTDGILLAETQHDRFLEKYEVLIIDEAHERSLNIDFLLGYLKRILPRRPDLKVIITSATIDLERFSKHFNDAPVIEVSGRTYPVDVLYRPLGEESSDNDQRQGILDAVDELAQHERDNGASAPGDILVFLSGEREIRETADFLRKAQLRNTEILPLYARLSVAEQNKIFHPGRSVGRRIVLATNVAETSLTVPGIRYVIDPGFARISRYSYRSKVQRLPIEPVSQASANQRKGRCGRVAAGICIRLYSEEDFLARPEFTDAEIRRTNLAAVILQMLNLRLGDIAEFPFIDPPDVRFVNDGFKLLHELGAVDEKRNMTRQGRELSKLPVDPRIGRMLLEAARQNCLKEVLVIASALSVQDPRERPIEKKQAADERHRAYASEDSDFITLVNLWNLYEEQRQELSQNQLRKFCQKQFLSFMRMREWRDIHRQLHLICKQQGYKENQDDADYNSIHKSLLSGLLSQMGFKQENKEYLGARNKKFHIFPGSMLFKKAPKWIMAAELVETSKLYARMVARIEPEWAEALAKHLVKRSYLEPHWEKKRAQVVALEQVSLYGLIIVPKRRIHYGKIEPEQSHEIFIRQALVEGEFETKGKFLKHNRGLLQDIEDLEAKSRRRDLLVDEESLYQFYFQRMEELDGGGVVNGAGFEHWRKGVEQNNPKALFMTEEDLLQRSADHVTAGQYPDNLAMDGIKLKLAYNFEPGARNDGVTLSTPIALLNQLPATRLEWLVPGMLREKCVAVMKGLPKQIRKNFVPIPDYVDAALEKINFGEGDLYEALALQLKRMTGVTVDPAALREVKLDNHFQVNLRVLDEKGKVQGESRNLQKLQHKFAEKVSEALKKGPGEKWGRDEITSWDFGELQESIRLRQAGGIEVDAYPAMLDKGDSVSLTVVTHKADADELSVLGIVRLAILSLTEQVRFARKQLPEIDKSVMLVGKVLDKRSLQDQCVQQAVRHLMNLDESLPRTEREFKVRLEQCRAELVDLAVKVARFVFECHKRYHDIQKKLKGRMDLTEVAVLNDVKMQLGALIHARYVSENSWNRLQNYPRYLKAIEMRLEKFRRNLPQERILSDQLDSYWSDYQRRLEQHKNNGVADPELQHFRWMLEEYRVSLFAQQLGTEYPVSDKRIRQQWQKVLV
ncbi:ATP-dependent RNA helicase HrpA [Pontibacterium sp.]|uniref:ATP-dependent RNA helicase HrpA n=2 Tax=Pontibacterium sp. TaxID=2036026 RepID=UPI00351239C9